MPWARAAVTQVIEPRHHRRAAGHDARARLLGEIVGAHDEAREPRLEVTRLGRERERC